MGKQSQLLLQATEVELGLQLGVEFDNKYWLDANNKSGKVNQMKCCPDMGAMVTCVGPALLNMAPVTLISVSQ